MKSTKYPDSHKLRASRTESAQAKKILSSLWRRAFNDGNVTFTFPKDRPGAAKKLHTQLADYRKYIRARRMSMLTEWNILTSVMLKMPDEFTVVLEKRSENKVSALATLIEVSGQSVSQTNTINLIDIIKDFSTPNIEP